MAENFYSDLNFKLDPDSAGNTEVIKNAESVRQSIKLILSTFPGERIMEPLFGSRIRTLLFEPIDEITVEFIKIEIQEAIETWENRVNITNLSVIPDEDKNVYNISISLNIIEVDANVEFEGKLKVVV